MALIAMKDVTIAFEGVVAVDHVSFEVERGDLLMYGHTHVPVLKKSDGVYYINPGSIAFPKNGYPASYAVMDGGHIELRRLDDDVPFMAIDLY